MGALATFTLMAALAAPPTAPIDPAIAAMHKDPALAAVLSQYAADGLAKKAADTLKRVRAKRPEAERAALNDPIVQLDVIDRRHAEWQKALAGGDAKQAALFLEDVRASEGKLLPAGRKGKLLQEMESRTPSAKGP